jgi:hypothetical protein
MAVCLFCSGFRSSVPLVSRTQEFITFDFRVATYGTYPIKTSKKSFTATAWFLKSLSRLPQLNIFDYICSDAVTLCCACTEYDGCWSHHRPLQEFEHWLRWFYRESSRKARVRRIDICHDVRVKFHYFPSNLFVFSKCVQTNIICEEGGIGLVWLEQVSLAQ